MFFIESHLTISSNFFFEEKDHSEGEEGMAMLDRILMIEQTFTTLSSSIGTMWFIHPVFSMMCFDTSSYVNASSALVFTPTTLKTVS